jgi:hypothetical protein
MRTYRSLAHGTVYAKIIDSAMYQPILSMKEE